MNFHKYNDEVDKPRKKKEINYGQRGCAFVERYTKLSENPNSFPH